MFGLYGTFKKKKKSYFHPEIKIIQEKNLPFQHFTENNLAKFNTNNSNP